MVRCRRAALRCPAFNSRRLRVVWITCGLNNQISAACRKACRLPLAQRSSSEPLLPRQDAAVFPGAGFARQPHIFLFGANLPGPHLFLTIGDLLRPREHARQLTPKEGSDMRAHRILLSLAIPAAFGIATQTAAFSEEYRGTLEQQMACTPDVFRLCGAQMPDANRIIACLRQNTPLSGACRAVFEFNASAAATDDGTPADRRRDDVTICRVAGPRGFSFADVDPFGGDQFGHPPGRDPHRAVGRARRRHHYVECFQRHVAIDRQRRLQSERADAADFMAGDVRQPRRARAFSACRRRSAFTFLLSIREVPLATISTTRSPIRKLSVFAIRPGSTP